MRKWMFIALMSLVIWACGGGGSEESSSSSSSSEPEKEKRVVSEEIAVQVFGETCVACHGASGEEAINGAKKFSESTLSLEERIEVITNGRESTSMTSYEYMGEEKIEALAKYTMKLGEAAKGGQ